MSAPLTSLLVRDHVVPVKKIEEAIQRQVISGGELATALLELGAVPENVICAYSAASVGLLPVTRDEVMNVPRDVVRIVPREVAEQHRLVPVSADGRQLVVACAQPLAREVREQLEFLLGMEISVRIATDVRIAAALAHSYAVEIAPRMRRLAERLSKQDAGIVPEIAPYEANVAQRPLDTVSRRETGAGAYERPNAADANRANPAPKLAAPSERPLVKPASPAPVAASRASNAAPSAVRPTPSPSIAAAPRASSAAPLAGAPASAAPKNAAPAPARTPSEPAASSGPPRSELVKKHRGPMSAQVAVELLGKAETRDDILAVSFAFMRQFFDCTAMFVVHDDVAEGLDAFGTGPAWEKVQKIAGSMSEPGTLEQVGTHLVPRVSQLDETPADRRFARELGREAQQPCLLLPVVIRQRVVILFYGDRGGEDFGLSDVPEPLGFVPRVSEALQRLIVRRKQRAAGGGPTHEPPKSAPPAKGTAGWSAPAASAKAAPVAPASKASSPAVPASKASSPAMPAAKKPSSTSSANIPAPSASGDRTAQHFAVLGVPRSAPPPPVVRPVITVGDAAPTRAPDPFRGEPPRAFARPASPTTPEKPASPPVESAPAATPAPAPDLDLDDEPEITVDEAEAEDLELGGGHRVGSYSQRGGYTDVVISRKPVLDALDAPPSATPRGARERAPSPAVSRSGDDEDGGDPALRSTVPMVDVPKVIVSMGDSVETVVSEVAFASREAADEHVRRVLEVGPAALPMLVQVFPGPVWSARTAASAPKTPRELSPVALALSAFGDTAAPYLVSLVSDEEPDIRFYALVTAEAMVHRELVAPLGVRIFDTDDAVANLAMQLLRKHRRFQREYQEVLDKVRSTARSPRVSERRRALALEALGELRDARSLRALLQFLEQGPERLARAAHQSLVLLTRQDFGDSAERWQPWIEEHGRKHRIEWLVDALLHPEEELRRVAGEELKQLTQEYFGYHHAAPRKEREIAQKKYRAWWDAEGHKKFA